MKIKIIFGDTLLFIPAPTNFEGNRQNSPEDTIEQEGDYMMIGCGYNYLKVQNESVLG